MQHRPVSSPATGRGNNKHAATSPGVIASDRARPQQTCCNIARCPRQRQGAAITNMLQHHSVSLPAIGHGRNHIAPKPCWDTGALRVCRRHRIPIYAAAVGIIVRGRISGCHRQVSPRTRSPLHGGVIAPASPHPKDSGNIGMVGLVNTDPATFQKLKLATSSTVSSLLSLCMSVQRCTLI